MYETYLQTSCLCLWLDRQIALMLQKKLHDAFQVCVFHEDSQIQA